MSHFGTWRMGKRSGPTWGGHHIGCGLHLEKMTNDSSERLGPAVGPTTVSYSYLKLTHRVCSGMRFLTWDPLASTNGKA